MPAKKKTLSLVELIIAIALLGVIVLGAFSFDIGSRHLLRASETKTQVLNEATLVLDYITKDALRGIGDMIDPALSINVAGFLLIKQDGNPDNGVLGNGIRDVSNAVDHVIAYGLNNNTDIIRCNITVDPPVINPAACQVLSRRAINAGFVITPNPIVDNTAHISVTLRFNPAQARDAFNNPQVTVQTDIEVPGQSLN